MQKFEGILICTDLDGTLLKNDKSVSSENIEAINYFKSSGGLFTFITGRMPYYSSKIYGMIEPNAPVGCINGGGLYDHRTEEYVWHAPDFDKDIFELIECVEKNVRGIGIQVVGYDRTYFSSENEATANFRRRTEVPNIQKYYKDVTEPIAKIVFADYNQDNIDKVDACIKSHPLSEKYSYLQSEKTLYEILPKGMHKGTVLLKMAEILGIDKQKTVAVGDYDNDIGMLRVAGAGIAVANASPGAKAAAKYITVSNEEHAIAHIIADIENGKIIV